MAVSSGGYSASHFAGAAKKVQEIFDRQNAQEPPPAS